MLKVRARSSSSGFEYLQRSPQPVSSPEGSKVSNLQLIPVLNFPQRSPELAPLARLQIVLSISSDHFFNLHRSHFQSVSNSYLRLASISSPQITSSISTDHMFRSSQVRIWDKTQVHILVSSQIASTDTLRRWSKESFETALSSPRAS